MDLKISPTTVQRQTIDRLRSAIIDQHFRPNERLVESVLCKTMGVSRTLLREALRHLEAEKLVTSTPNRGPSVTAIGWEEAEEIYHVRGMLEGEAAAMFAPRVQPEHLALMRAALEAFSQADEKGDVFGRINSTSSFYDVITRNCGNRIIHESLKNLTARINFIRVQSMSQGGRSKQSIKEMNTIYSALRSKDPELARAAAIQHVRSACEVARGVFKTPSL